MPTNGRPGVFFQESFQPLATGGGGIPGEALPCFAGIYPGGPTAPWLVTSWNQFLIQYGSFSTPATSNTNTPSWALGMNGRYLLPFAVYEFFQNGGSQCIVLSLANSDATSASLQLEDTPATTDIVTVTASSPGVWGQSIFVEVVAVAAGYFNFNVYFGNSSPSNLVETFPYVTMNPRDPSGRFMATLINSPIGGSHYVSVAVTFPSGGYVAGTTDLAAASPTPLTGASDGSIVPVIGTVIPTALDTLPDQAMYVNVPGLSSTSILGTLASWAAGRGDTMIVCDGPTPTLPETNATVYTNYVNMVTGGSALPVSSYMALYAPWVLVQDPSSTAQGAATLLPPGGLVLGQWQQNDVASGTVQTPAGTQAVLNVVDLETRFTSTQLNGLNNYNINALKIVPGVGFCIFGGRTLDVGYPTRYIAVRRMLIKLEHDFNWLLQPALFQPNDAQLWAWVTSTLQNYLMQQMQAGQLGGTTPSTSYLVTCDSTNNTLATASAGIITATVAVSLLSPAEFINITISQFQGTGTTTVTTSTS